MKCSYSPSKRHGKQPSTSRVAVQHQRYLQSAIHNQTPQVPLGSDSFIQYQPHAAGFPVPGTPTTVSHPIASSSAGQYHTPGSSVSFSNPWSGIDTTFASALPSSPSTTPTSRIQESNMASQLEPAFQAPQVHDCEAKALDTIHSLRHSPTINLETIATHRQIPRELIPQLPSLDKILHFNRIAINTVQQLIGCACAHQPYLALQYMAIVAKTLLWYRVAVNLSFKTAAPLPEGSNVPYPLSPISTTSTTSNSAGRAMPMPNTVQIGSFDLEEEDEAMLVRSVVVKEIKKAGRLVEFMRSYDIGQGATDEHGQEGFNLGSWYRTGGEKLARDVQDTLRVIMENCEPRTTEGSYGQWSKQPASSGQHNPLGDMHQHQYQ